MISRAFWCVAGALLTLLAVALPAFAQCPGDLNADGRTDGTDLSVVLAQWGNCGSGSSCGGDLNEDGTVNGTDLTALLAGWGPCVTVPAWATLLEAYPDPAVVHREAARDAIIATGLAWRVRDTATQIEFLLIPPGMYERGCSPSSNSACSFNEVPVHQVTLTQPFYMGRYEVTQAQWQARMGVNPSAFQSATAQVPTSQVLNRPVEQVSYSAVQGFLAATGMRLPTEAEWEYAYRAGTTTAFHSMPGHPNGTDTDSLAGNIAWLSSNASNQTRPVGQKAANAFGMRDMAGNVWEWVSDWYGDYSADPQTNPTGASEGVLRVIRGGSWLDVADGARSSYRIGNPPGNIDSFVGFRVARTP